MSTTTRERRSSTQLWMRYVSFVNARNLLLLLVKGHPTGITAKDMDALVKREGVLTTQRGKGISRTTTFHLRNALYHLGFLELHKRLYTPTFRSAMFEILMQSDEYSKQLTINEKIEFARQIFNNRDCRDVFLFLFGISAERLEDAIAESGTARWRSEPIPEPDLLLMTQIAGKAAPGNRGLRRWRIVVSTSDHEVILQSEDEVQAVFYGIRYWLLQLGFLNEMFFESEGGHSVMFLSDPRNSDIAILDHLKNKLVPGVPWTPLQLRPLVLEIAIREKATLDAVHDAFRRLVRRYPQYVYFIPTARSFATITATSANAEEFQLRGYLRDDQGRIISHLRLHEKLGEVNDTAI